MKNKNSNIPDKKKKIILKKFNLLNKINKENINADLPDEKRKRGKQTIIIKKKYKVKEDQEYLIFQIELNNNLLK